MDLFLREIDEYQLSTYAYVYSTRTHFVGTVPFNSLVCLLCAIKYTTIIISILVIQKLDLYATLYVFGLLNIS
jgi:hypothetical protein